MIVGVLGVDLRDGAGGYGEEIDDLLGCSHGSHHGTWSSVGQKGDRNRSSIQLHDTSASAWPHSGQAAAWRLSSDGGPVGRFGQDFRVLLGAVDALGLEFFIQLPEGGVLRFDFKPIGLVDEAEPREASCGTRRCSRSCCRASAQPPSGDRHHRAEHRSASEVVASSSHTDRTARTDDPPCRVGRPDGAAASAVGGSFTSAPRQHAVNKEANEPRGETPGANVRSPDE